MEARTFDRIGSPIPTLDQWRASPWRALRTSAYWIFSDENLVRRARTGDHTAFDVLVARHRERLHTMALGSLRSEDKAVDALGEMVLTASRDIRSFDAECTPGAWLYLHGLRAVIKRMAAPLGQYAPSVVSSLSAVSGDEPEPPRPIWALASPGSMPGARPGRSITGPAGDSAARPSHP